MDLGFFKIMMIFFALALLGLAFFLLFFQKKVHKRIKRYFFKRDDEY